MGAFPGGFPRRHYRDGRGVCSVCSAHGPSLAAAIARARRDDDAHIAIEATPTR